MRKNFKLLGAVAVAGLVATTGSAFTATSTIDDATVAVGTTSQSITGVSVSSVAYTVGANDTTTNVAFHVTQETDVNDVVKAKITSGTNTGTQTAPVYASEEITCGGDYTVAGTNYTCNYTGVVNVTSLSIVAS